MELLRSDPTTKGLKMSLAKLHTVGRSTSLLLVPVMCLFLTAWPVLAQGNIATIAGNGSQGFFGDGVPALSAGLNHPRGLAVDSSGNLYISDLDNHRIRRVSPSGMISTFAGNGVIGDSGDGGLAVNASLSDVSGLALDAAGNLYIADAGNRKVKKVTPGGVISTFAGTGVQGFSGDTGPATSAQLNRPTSVFFSAAGNLYIADSSNHRIRKVSSNGTITTVAGNGVAGFSGDLGLATNASLDFPLGIAMDSADNLYVADGNNNRIRRISPSGVITTAAGNGAGRFAGDQGPAISASLNIPEGVAFDGSGNLLIADSGNNRIRKVSSGLISTIVGTGVDGFSGDGGPATQAMLSLPWGLTTNAAGSIYIADRVNNRVRMVSVSSLTGVVPSLAENSTVNGASFAKIAIAPGAIVSIFGSDFAGSELRASSVPLPTALGDTSVTFNGIAAPLFYVSNGQIGQINAQAPFELPAGFAVSIQVRRGSNVSTVRTASVAAVSPGIFIVDQATSAGAVLHADYSLVSSSSPARPGEILLIYCTGLGPLRTPVRSGDPGPERSETINLPTVRIGGLPANVTYSGLAPGFVGLYQINAQAPAGLSAGNQALQITTLGVASNTATIAVTR